MRIHVNFTQPTVNFILLKSVSLYAIIIHHIDIDGRPNAKCVGGCVCISLLFDMTIAFQQCGGEKQKEKLLEKPLS